MATHSNNLAWEIPWISRSILTWEIPCSWSLANYSPWVHKRTGHNLATKQQLPVCQAPVLTQKI